MTGLIGSYNRLLSFSMPLARLAHRGGEDHSVSRADDAVHASTDRLVRLEGTTLALDGALWNRDALARSLDADPASIRTDAQAVAMALHRWGLDGLSFLDGMFALSWTSPEGKHYLARDRFGEVPLYVWNDGGRFVWASERKAFPPNTPARLLGPGEIFNIQSGNAVPWYTIPYCEDAPDPDLPDLIERAVQRRLPVGDIACLLSGGLDSAMILTLAKRTGRRVVAFTAKLENDTQDLRAARDLCVLYGIELVEVEIPFPSSSSLRAAIACIETPRKPQVEIATACIPLAREIARRGFTSVLSGEGADELFGGYAAMIRNFDVETRPEAWHIERRDRITAMASASLIRTNLAFANSGVQCRLPYLDRGLVEAVLSMSPRACPPGKLALKSAAKGIVPDWVIGRPRDTFQQGTGITRATETAIQSPATFCESAYRAQFGVLA